jgi:hypothetical protein
VIDFHRRSQSNDMSITISAVLVELPPCPDAIFWSSDIKYALISLISAWHRRLFAFKLSQPCVEKGASSGADSPALGAEGTCPMLAQCPSTPSTPAPQIIRQNIV